MKKLISLVVVALLLLFTLQFFGGINNLKALTTNLTQSISIIKDQVITLTGRKESEKNIARSDQGEIHLEGEIRKIQSNPRSIEIKLHMDDNHPEIKNPILIAHRAVIKIREKEVTFRSLKIGDIVGIILNQDGKARSITVYNR
jgi:hypothetical protein